ncbi:hypothetical protein, partial [Flexivirga oryzae]
MNTHELRWWRRRSVIAVALLLVVAVALSALLLGRHEDDRGRMAVGDSLQGDYSLSDATYEHDLSFQLPGSVLSVSVAVGQRASSDETGGSVEAKAPRDGQLVHVTWSATRSSSDGAPDTGDHASRLAVRSKTTSVVVDRAVKAPAQGSSTAGDDDRNQALVAVPGDAADVQLTVTFEGRTQSVSLVSGERRLGAFASLYRPRPASAQVSQTQDQPADERSGYWWFCTAEARLMTRAPYVDGLGWAPAGREWVVVTGAGVHVADTPAVRRADGRVAEYELDGTPKVAVTIDGDHAVKSTRAVRTHQDGTGTTRDYVFSIRTGAAATVDVRAVVR